MTMIQQVGETVMYNGRPHTLIMEPCEHCGEEPTTVQLLPAAEPEDLTPLSKWPTWVPPPNEFKLSCGHVVGNYQLWLEPVKEK